MYTIESVYVCRNSVIDCIVLTSHLKIVEKDKKKRENERYDRFSFLFFFSLSIEYMKLNSDVYRASKDVKEYSRDLSLSF